MKSIVKLGALFGALICVTTFASTQPAEAHNSHRDRARECERVRNFQRAEAYNNCAVQNHPLVSQMLYRFGL